MIYYQPGANNTETLVTESDHTGKIIPYRTKGPWTFDSLYGKSCHKVSQSFPSAEGPRRSDPNSCPASVQKVRDQHAKLHNMELHGSASTVGAKVDINDLMQ